MWVSITKYDYQSLSYGPLNKRTCDEPMPRINQDRFIFWPYLLGDARTFTGATILTHQMFTIDNSFILCVFLISFSKEDEEEKPFLFIVLFTVLFSALKHWSIPNNQLPKCRSCGRSLHLPSCFMLCGDHLPLSSNMPHQATQGAWNSTWVNGYS